MARGVNDECPLPEAARLAPMWRLAAMLCDHQEGICHYTSHPITTARLEAGNVAIGMIRERVRSPLDTEHFKVKILQSALPGPKLGPYALT